MHIRPDIVNCSKKSLKYINNELTNIVKDNITFTNEYGEKVSEQEFFQFEYAYFITKNFPYFLAKYNGIIESTNNNNSDCSGHGVTWVQELDHRQKVVIN